MKERSAGLRQADATRAEIDGHLLRAIIDGIPDCIFWKTRDGRFVGCNAAYAAFRGFASIDDVIGRTMHEIGLPPDEAARIIALEEELMVSGEPLIGKEEIIVTDAGLRTMIINRMPMKDAAGNVTGLLGIFFDVTHRKRAEDALKNQKALLEAVFDAVPLPMFVKDADGVFLHCNRDYAETVGVALPEILGRRLGDFAPRRVAEVAERKDQDLLASRTTQTYEVSIATPHGARREIEVRKAVFGGTPGSSRAGLVGVLVDLTERKRAEAIFLQMSKEKALGSLAAGMAHELNNLLLPLVALSRILVKKCPADAPDLPKLQAIAEAARRSADIIGRVLALSRQTDEPMEPIDPSAVVGSALQSLRMRLPPGVELTDSLPRGSKNLLGNAVQLRMAVEQLLANALDALKEGGGRIRVSLLQDAVGFEEVSGLAPGPVLRLRVFDNGCGMAPEIVERAIDPFFTTKDVGAGCGLGLTLVQKIVDHHQGRLRIVSKPGKGTIVDVFLPRMGNDRGSDGESARDR